MYNIKNGYMKLFKSIKKDTCRSMMAYSNNAPKTKNIQQMTQDCIAFNPSAFGEFVVVVLKIFT